MEGTDDKARAAGNLWLTTREAAALLRYSPAHLKRLRQRGEGPPCKRVGPRHVRYNRDAILSWLNQQPSAVAR